MGSIFIPDANRALSTALRSEGSVIARTRDLGSLKDTGRTFNWSARRFGMRWSTVTGTSRFLRSSLGTPVFWARKSMSRSSLMKPRATRLLPMRPPVMRWCRSASCNWAKEMSSASTSISPIFLFSDCMWPQPFHGIRLEQVYIYPGQGAILLWGSSGSCN